MRDLGPALVLLTIIAAAAVLIIWSLTLRYRRQELKHKERMAALEKGAELPSEPAEPCKPWSPRIYLLRGLIWLFTGASLSMFLLGISLTAPVRQQTIQERLFEAQNLRQRGATEDEIKQLLNSKEPASKDKLPPGFALIGLIPAGVGLAYLIYYRGESKPEAL